MTRTPPVLPGLGGGPAAPLAAFNVETLLASAIQAQDAGRAAEAERGYRTLLTIAPRDARIPAHLAVLLLEQGRNAEALPVLEQALALDPGQSGMLVNKGNALIALERVPEAVAAYGQAIALQPEVDRAPGWVNLGVYLESLKRHDDAAEAYLKAIALDPDLPEAWGNLGIARLTAGRAEEALEALDRAVQLRPGYADAWTNRGTALQELRRLDEALQSFDRALALQPDMAEVWSGRSLALHEMGRLDESAEASARAVSLDPAGASAWNNRGMALQSLGRIEEARASFDKAISLKDEFPDALWNKALLLLALGEYEEGWKLFEWRWRRSDPGAERPRDFGVPAWLGETPIAGKRLLLHAEQGYGDAIQMLRYVPVLAGMGAKVMLVCPEPLVELANTVEGLAAPAASEGFVGFDAHTPLMSLPLALKTRLDTVPAEVPYLRVPERARAAWAGRLEPSGKPRVGLAWSGNPAHRNDRNRSLSFAALGPLLQADAEFHSLQRDYRPGELDALKADGRVRDHSAELLSFADTAALIDRMDVVVAVDTSAAHLAGALGKRLLVLLPFAPDFRWGLGRPDTPWYPTARLLRQATAGDWGPVLAEAAAAVNALG
jgi:tetratricopeptide (TPR) repeat protein